MYHRAELLQRELRRVDGANVNAETPKYQKMATSAFVFYRGSAQLFYADIANGTIRLPEVLSELPLTTIMGDCHASNFGFLTEEGSHGDRVIFAPNDFDDACIGRAEWDLLRFCVSLALCHAHCDTISGDLDVVSPQQVTLAIEDFLTAYVQTCKEGIAGTEHLLQALDSQCIAEYPILKKACKKAVKRASGGEHFYQKSTLAKAVNWQVQPLAFRALDDKFARVDPQLYQELERFFSPYMHDCIWDIVARKNAGTGSVNMQRYYFLVGPKNCQLPRAFPLFHLVEVKKQRVAAPLYFFPELSPNNRLNPAHLTLMCQRRMQRFPDLVLDEVEWNNEHWLVRSRHHAKVGIDPEDIATGRKAVDERGFNQYAQACGKALALAHCRGDRRSTQFEVAVADVLPGVVEAVKSSALSYAEQVTSDWLWLKEQVQAGI